MKTEKRSYNILSGPLPSIDQRVTELHLQKTSIAKLLHLSTSSQLALPAYITGYEWNRNRRSKSDFF